MYTYVKRRQAAYMDQLISDTDIENVIMQVDFSENASTIVQKEIQSAYCHAWIDCQ